MNKIYPITLHLECGHGWKLTDGQQCPNCLLFADIGNSAPMRGQGAKALRVALKVLGATQEQQTELIAMGLDRGYFAAINEARRMQRT